MIGFSEFDIDKARRNNANVVTAGTILLSIARDHNSKAFGTRLPGNPGEYMLLNSAEVLHEISTVATCCFACCGGSIAR